MAKEDFCFTYYDGDAARDKAHMNRLERGAYDDLISAQRKRGHLSLEDIKKVLGRDFEVCWAALEWVLEKDGDKYFIEWVDKSLAKSRAHSAKQKQKIDKYWTEVKQGKNKRKTVVKLRNNSGTGSEEPLEDGDGNGDVNVIKDEKGKGKKSEKLVLPYSDPEFVSAWNTLLTQSKWKKKSPTALQASLKKLSGREVWEAIKMIENTIGGEWQGLFELKAEEKSTKKNAVQSYLDVNAQQEEEILRMHGKNDTANS